jgi:hypothetical protein
MKTHVFGVTADGGLWHTIVGEQDYLDMDVHGTHGVPWTGTVVDAACAADDDGNLHVLVVADGKLWHTVRSPGGLADSRWTTKTANGTSFGDVGAVVGGESGKFMAVTAYTTPKDPPVVAATDKKLDLHVVAATDNKLWHTIRRPTGNAPIHEAKGGMWISPRGVQNRFEEEKRQGEAKDRQFRILESVRSVK